MVWMAWVLAVAHLGYADLAEPAEALIRRGFIPGGVMDAASFRKDLKRALGDPETVGHCHVVALRTQIEGEGPGFSFTGRGRMTPFRGRATPFRNGVGSKLLQGCARHEMALEVEGVVDSSMGR